MKISRAWGALGFAAAAASAALQPGDVAFVGFNADGNDDIAFVTFKDIPAGDTLRFCDDEWNGAGFTTGENEFAWVATSLVPAGTVVTINNLSLAAGSATASTGTLPLALDNSGGMSATSEAMFLFQGPAPRTVGTMLAAVSNDTAAFASTGTLAGLAGSGLTYGVHALALPASTDIGVYNGPRTGLSQAGYLAAIANISGNWQVEATSADDQANGSAPDLPFNTTVFALAAAPVIPALAFDKAYYTVKENVGAVTVRLNASVAPSDTATVQIRLAAGGTAAAGTDFVFADQAFVWPKDSAGFRTLSIPVTNNAAAQPDRFFVLELKSPTGATLGSQARTLVYLLDDDAQAPASSSELDLRFVSSFKAADSGSAEIAAHDPKSKRLFVMNSVKDRLEILNFKNPRALAKIASIDLSAFGSGGTSVAFKDGLVAVTIDGVNFQPGKVVLLDTNGTVLKNVTVGSLPDMVAFSPDGKLLLTANEGQPSADYLTDPEGSVSVIDLSGGIANLSQANVTTMTFNAFDAQKDALKAQGVRIFGANNPSVSKDLEPEYITVSEDSKTAWITLQENNAIAKADLITKTITHIFPLGLKDHSLPRNALDASDQLDSTVFMGTWPVKGVYMPDAIASLKVGDSTWLFTANEGDAREYGSFVEDIRVGSSSYKLDSAAFPNAAVLKLNTNLGRLTVSPFSGDLDGDGDFDQIHAFGARSFSVWNGATGAQVWDSGDELERVTAKDAAYGRLFNASNDNTSLKNRSDNKGPEPEGIVVGKIGPKAYVFVALERTGGVVAYEVTNPKAPRFVAYANNRAPVSTTNDLGAEGILFIPRASSPTDTALIVLANEVSATVSVYSVRDTNVVSGLRAYPAGAAAKGLVLHWSADRTALFFSRPVDFRLSDLKGRPQRSGKNAAWADLKGLQRGRYFLTVPGEEAFSILVTQ